MEVAHKNMEAIRDKLAASVLFCKKNEDIQLQRAGE